MNRILFATSNPHKLREVEQILAQLGIRVVGLGELAEPVPEPVEDGDTFEANAALKAVGYAKATGLHCLADDSGLEVDALGGAPGVHSARYAGVEGSRAERDQANNDKLLAKIAEIPEADRAARFVCAMCLAAPSGEVIVETRGAFEGVLTDRPRGENGFGYDPLLYLPDAGRTSAELSSEQKNARSHRGQATRAMTNAIAELESSSPSGADV